MSDFEIDCKNGAPSAPYLNDLELRQIQDKCMEGSQNAADRHLMEKIYAILEYRKEERAQRRAELKRILHAGLAALDGALQREQLERAEHND